MESTNRLEQSSWLTIHKIAGTTEAPTSGMNEGEAMLFWIGQSHTLLGTIVCSI